MRVLVADDHSLFRDGITSLLEAAGFSVIGQVGNGEAAIAAVEALQPDLVLMDITMPRLTGLEALSVIKARWPETKVVMLTVSEEDRDLFEAIRNGANGYLLKDLNADDFLEMLDGLRRGEAAMSRQTAAQLMRGFADLTSHEASPATPLTEREMDILQLVAEGLSNKAISRQLSISDNTVKYHMKNILQKLGAQNRTEAVTYAIRVGILDPASPL